MYRTLVGLIVSLVAALGLVGLTFSASVDSRAQFRFINASDPKTLDPQLATGEPEHRILDGIFEGLTRPDPKTLAPLPGVAESWELSLDEQRYTFKIRPEARWSDGRPLTAADFVYSWKRLLDPATGAEYAYILHMVRHAEAYNTYAGHSASLRGPVRAALLKLQQDAAPTLDARKLQTALEQVHAHAALATSTDPRVAKLITTRSGEIARTELDYFAERLEVEAQILDAALQRAQAHLGVDEGVYAPDERTLEVELRAPTPHFLQLTAFYPTFPVPQHLLVALQNSPAWFLPENIVSNGPYRLRRWIVNDRIRLEKSETYWDRAAVKTASIEALPVENTTTALNLFLTDEVQWLSGSYPIELAARLRQRPDFYSGPAMTVYYYRLNCERGALKDRRVRQAINLALDRRVIVEDVLGLGQEQALGVVPPGLPGYTSPQSEIRYDPARAQQLLADAGYPNGQGLPELGILYNTMAQHKKIAEVVADQLRRNLGIQATAYNQEWQSYLATVRSGDYDMARAGWVGDYLDPNTFLDLWVTNGGNNQTGFSSPKYDVLIRAAGNIISALERPGPMLDAVKDRALLQTELAALQVATPSERSAALKKLRLRLLAEAEHILVAEEFPIVPVYFYVQSGMISPRVQGFYSQLEYADGTRAPNHQDLHPLSALVVSEP